MLSFNSFVLLESESSLKFHALPLAKDKKTLVYEVEFQGEIVGQVKWSSRLRSYDYFPIKKLELPIKSFIQQLNAEHRKNRQK